MSALVVHASQLDRAMKCPGFNFFKDLPKEPPGAAAEEGTAFGEYVERLLSKQPIGQHARNGVYFDDDMKYYATDIAEEVRNLAVSDIHVENKVDWQTKSGAWIRGRYDISFVDRDGSLCIDDCKYGYGIVEAPENWQLIAYAIGEVMRLGKSFTNIVLRIRQPRPHHEDGPTREWKITYKRLLEYKDQIEAHFDKLAEGFNDLVTGPQCKYCPAAGAACPAISKAMYHGVDLVHEFIQDNITDAELSQQLDLMDRVGEVFKTKNDSLKALAVDRIRQGKIVPNYITEQGLANRNWKPGITPQVIQLMTGIDVTEKIILSPAKAEKAGVPKEIVSSMVDRALLGMKLKRSDGSEGKKLFGNKQPVVGKEYQ